VREFTADGRRDREDRLATEEPLEVRLAWPGRAPSRVAVTMRTPGHDFELAVGFLHAEGLLEGTGIRTVAYCVDSTLTAEQQYNVVTVELDGPPPRDPAQQYGGPSAAASACGVCGKQSIDDVLHLCSVAPPSQRWADLTVPAPVLRTLPDRLRGEQRVFDSTGGLHAAGLFDTDGRPVVIREDIGRHNAVDKVVGSRLLGGQPTAVPVMCVSGRIGFEIVQKAVAAGVGVLAAVGAPSNLAVRLAADAGLCTVGFLRHERFVTYTAPERIGV
jgi:FdhD protein